MENRYKGCGIASLPVKMELTYERVCEAIHQFSLRWRDKWLQSKCRAYLHRNDPDILAEQGMDRASENQFEEAVALYVQAAEKGSLKALYLLGQCCLEGSGCACNVQKGVEFVRKSAQRGYAPAQFLISQFRRNGERSIEDQYEALQWAEKAAWREDSYENFLIYESDVGSRRVGRRSEREVYWLRKSAHSGQVPAMYSLAQYYMKKRMKLSAVKWLYRAARHGDSKAQYELGTRHMYYGEKYSPIDRFWLERAAENGLAKAQWRLGNLYRDESNADKAFDWYRQAAEQGDKDGWFYLGKCYEAGIGTKANWELAQEWYKKAMEQGQSGAFYAYHVLRQRIHSGETETDETYDDDALLYDIRIADPETSSHCFVCATEKVQYGIWVISTGIHRFLRGISRAIHWMARVRILMNRLGFVCCPAEGGEGKMWRERKTGLTLTSTELLGFLLRARRQVAVLQGPTGCGKTRLVRRLKTELSDKVWVLAVDAFRENFKLFPQPDLFDFITEARRYEVICVEDIDFIRSFKYLQIDAAHAINQLAQNMLVVLDGIDCSNRISLFFEELHCDVSVFEHI